MRHALVFGAVAIADAMWTRYTLAVSGHHAYEAAIYSALIVVVGGFVTLSYVKDRRYLLPAALGAFLGTYLSVRG